MKSIKVKINEPFTIILEYKGIEVLKKTLAFDESTVIKHKDGRTEVSVRGMELPEYINETIKAD